MRTSWIVLASLAVTSVAAAEPEPVSVGVRVGGYGFRREGDSSANSWSQCRMGGMGVFANRNVRGPLFLEAGLDTYSTSNQPQPQDLPIDRQSALLSMAAGVRSSFTSWLAGYAQVGVGAELTRVAVPYGDTTIRDDKLLPDGFVGVGADLKLGHATYVGAAFRTLVMGNFNYDPARLEMSNAWVAAPSANQVFDASPGFAAQAQFYLRHEL